MPSDVPEGWSIERLGDVVELALSNVDKKSKPDELPVKLCNYMDVYRNETITAGLDFMPATATSAQIDKFGLRRGDVMITKDSEDPTDIAVPSVVVEDLNEAILCGYHLALLRPMQAVYGEYLAYALRSFSVNDQFVRRANGATRYGITSGVIQGAKIPLPPLAEQRKIAAILSSVDGAIQATEAVIAQTRRVKEGLLQELLTKGIGHTRFKKTAIGEIPETWEVKRMEDVGRVIDSLHQTPKFSDEGYPMVRVTDIKGGNLDLNATQRVSKEVFEEFTKKYFPKKGDTILSRVGSVGLSVFVKTDAPFCIGQNTVIISPKINSELLNYSLQSTYIQDQMLRDVDGSSQKTLSLKNIRGLLFALPGSTEQDRIVEILSEVDKAIVGGAKQLTRLQQTKAGLLQDLLTGKVRVRN